MESGCDYVCVLLFTFPLVLAQVGGVPRTLFLPGLSGEPAEPPGQQAAPRPAAPARQESLLSLPLPPPPIPPPISGGASIGITYAVDSSLMLLALPCVTRTALLWDSGINWWWVFHRCRWKWEALVSFFRRVSVVLFHSRAALLASPGDDPHQGPSPGPLHLSG